MADRTGAELLRAAALAAQRRVVRRRPWADRPARLAAAAGLVEPDTADPVPWHSEACTCPVEDVTQLPCDNCRRDKPREAL